MNNLIFMELFTPSNFKDIFDIFSSLITGLIASLGVFYAIQTYFIAREAKDEWKFQRNIDFLSRLSSSLHLSREYLISLRQPLSMSSEIDLDIKHLFIKNPEEEKVLYNVYKEQILVLSRRKRYEKYIDDSRNILFESVAYFDESHIIQRYFRYIIKMDNEMLSAVRTLSYNKLEELNFEYDEYDQDLKNQIKKENREIRSKIYKMGNDKISIELEQLFNECLDYLKTVRKNINIGN